jgi:hypothetical protein
MCDGVCWPVGLKITKQNSMGNSLQCFWIILCHANNVLQDGSNLTAGRTKRETHKICQKGQPCAPVCFSIPYPTTTNLGIRKNCQGQTFQVQEIVVLVDNVTFMSSHFTLVSVHCFEHLCSAPERLVHGKGNLSSTIAPTAIKE